MRSILKIAECHINVSHYDGSNKMTRHAKFIIINLDINVLYHGLSLGPEAAILSCGPSIHLRFCQWWVSCSSTEVDVWVRHNSDVAPHNCVPQA